MSEDWLELYHIFWGPSTNPSPLQATGFETNSRPSAQKPHPAACGYHAVCKAQWARGTQLEPAVLLIELHLVTH